MSNKMQQYFKDLPEASEVMSDIFLPATLSPELASSAGRTTDKFLKQGMFCTATDLAIQNSALKCEIIRIENDLMSVNTQLDQEKNNLRIELQNRQASEERSRILLQEQMEMLSSCQHDLAVSEEKYLKLCQQDQNSRDRCDKLSAEVELSAAALLKKSEEFSSILREKDVANDDTTRKLSEALSEKAIIEESFRLFKSSILTELEKEGENSADNKLTIKIRLLQESNAQLSAEVKNMTRRCIDSDVELAALKEELSLSDRMKSRLSSSVDNQCKEIDVLEKKLLLANKLLLQEQAAREEAKEAGRSFELQLIQSKFTNERSEIAILDLKETKENLEKALADQMQENQRWVDRLKNVEKSTYLDQDKLRREYALTFEREMQLEKQKLARKEGECLDAHASLQTVSKSLDVVNKENKQLHLQILSLKSQLEHFSEIESCVADFQTELENKEDEIATLCQAFEKRGEAIKELEKRVSLQASEISFLRPERDSKAKIAKAFEGKLSALESEKSELLRVSTQNDTRGSIIDELKMTIMQYEKQLKDINDDKGSLHNSNMELDALKTDYRILKDDYEEAEETMVELSKAAAEEIRQREKQIHTFQLLVQEKEQEGVIMRDEINALKKAKAKLEKIIKEKEKAEAEAAWFSK